MALEVPALILRTLGVLELRDAHGTPAAGRPKVLALLAWLRTRARPATRSEIASLLWESYDTARARQSLRQALLELRGLLPPDALSVDGELVAVAEGRVAIDTDRFATAVAAQDDTLALSLYGGEFLRDAEELGGEEWRVWIEGERARLRRLLFTACQRLVTDLRERGAWRDALSTAERWSALAPLDEAPLLALVRTSLAAGDATTAASYRDAFVARLRADGLSPSAAVLRLDREIGDAPAADRLQRALLTPDLSGRGAEFSRLSDAWLAVTAGAARTVGLDGEAGSGRTRLLRDFVRARRAAGDRAITIEASDLLGATEEDGRTLGNLLDELAEAPGLLGAAAADLQSLARYSGRLAERFPPTGTDALPRLDDALPRLLAAIGDEEPLVIAVDDADRADVASQRALLTLAQRLPAGVLLILATQRGRVTPDVLAQGLSALGDRAELLRLGPLGATDTAALIASMAPFAPDAVRAIATAAVEDLGGLPGHTRALVTELATDGLIARDPSGVWGLLAPLTRPVVLPEGLLRAGREAMRALSPGARVLLERAAVMGSRLNLGALESASGLGASAFEEVVAELLATRRLRAVREVADTVEFPTEAARRAVLEGLSPARRRELASPDRRAASPSRRARWAIAALILLAVMTGATVLSRAPAAAPDAILLLADVANATGDSTFDRSLTLAATIDLAESRRFRLYPRSRVRETLSRMGRSSDDVGLDPELAMDIAERDGVPIVLAMSLESEGDGYRLIARLLAPGRRDAVRTLTEPIAARADVIAATGRLLDRVRRAMGESRAEIGADRRGLPQVTTGSLEALRWYAVGDAAWTRRDHGEARAAWSKAVALDSGFAMAWSALSDVDFFTNNPVDGRAKLVRAQELADRLTPRERLIILAKVEDRMGSVATGIEHRRALAQRYPDRDTWYSLGTVLMRNRQCADALPALRRALTYDAQFTNAHINIATCHLIERRPDSAIVAYLEAERTDSTVLRVGNIGEEFGRTLVLGGREDEAAQHFVRMSSWGADWNRARGHRHLSWLAMSEGRYAQSLRHAERALTLLGSTPAPASLYRDRMLRAYALAGSGRVAEARKELEENWRGRVESAVSGGFFVYTAAAARLVGAPRLVTDIRVAVERDQSAPPSEFHSSLLAALTAYEALLAGRTNDAITRASAFVDPDVAEWTLVHVVLADALVAAGRDAEGLKLWERIAERPSRQFELQETWQTADLQIARLAHRLGDRARALDALDRLLARWVRADEDLPTLEEARRLRASLLSSD